MATHVTKHEVEAREDVTFKAIPQVVEQAKSDATGILASNSATVVDKWMDTDYVYVRVRSPSGEETVLKYDAATKRLIGHDP
jgi:hypothetical protein